MLDAAREEQTQLRTQLEIRAAFGTAQDEGDASSTLLSEVLTSPMFGRLHSTDTEHTSWAPTVSTPRSIGLSRSLGSSEPSYFHRDRSAQAEGSSSRVRRRKGEGHVKLQTQSRMTRPASLDMSDSSRRDSVSSLLLQTKPPVSESLAAVHGWIRFEHAKLAVAVAFVQQFCTLLAPVQAGNLGQQCRAPSPVRRPWSLYYATFVQCDWPRNGLVFTRVTAENTIATASGDSYGRCSDPDCRT
jgi:hypothetical protein